MKIPNRRKIKVSLRVEELESRLVPSQASGVYLSSNWSGYSIDAPNGAVSDVKGSWIVPTVTVSGRGTAYAATWLGIDGDNSPSVEQIGTDSDQVSGKASYYAWYEMYPANPVYLDGKVTETITRHGITKTTDPGPLPIHPGDTINAEVYFNGTAFVLTITDTNDSTVNGGGIVNGTYTTTIALAGADRSSAEWIVEAPSNGYSILKLDNFGSATFTNAVAAIGSSVDQPIGYYASSAIPSSTALVYQINMAGQNVDSTGPLSTVGDSFTVNYGSTTPPAPTNGPVQPLKYGSMDHLANVQVTTSPASTVATDSIPAVVAISAATPPTSIVVGHGAVSVENVVANAPTMQPEIQARAAFFNQSEALLAFGVPEVSMVNVNAGEAYANAGFDMPWYGLPSIPGADPFAAAPIVVLPPAVDSDPESGDGSAPGGEE